MNDQIEPAKTPLQRILGFRGAEETYDQLPFIDQLILDLKMEDLTFHQISAILDMPYTTIYDRFIKIRHHMALSKLRLVLETRIYYKESHPIVLGHSESQE